MLVTHSHVKMEPHANLYLCEIMSVSALLVIMAQIVNTSLMPAMEILVNMVVLVKFWKRDVSGNGLSIL